VGYVPNTDPKTGLVIPEQALLWGQTHYKEEQSFLVASEYPGQPSDESAPPVGLVKANIPVQYRIKDLYAYIYNHSDPVSLLENLCYQELTRFTAGSKIEVDPASTGPEAADESLLGRGRARAKEVLFERIQKAADEQNLGIEVVFVGLQGIHPPPEVAPDYEAVIGAIQKKQALVLEAEAERNRTLSSLIGSVMKAYELADLAAEYQLAQSQERPEDAERLGVQLDEAFAEAKGDVYKILSEAQSYAFQKATLAQATGQRFAGQLKAYRAAPEIFTRQQRLAVLEKALAGIRKYIVVADANDTQVTIVDLQEKSEVDLFNFGATTQESSAQ
jgi:membrane protease subunit HflK